MSWWTTTRGAITSTRSSSRARSISPSKASAWPFRRPSSSGSRAEIPNLTGSRGMWASSSTTKTSPAPASSSATRGSRRRAGRRKSSGCSRAGSNTSWTPSPTRTSSTSPRSIFPASSKRRIGWIRPSARLTLRRSQRDLSQSTHFDRVGSEPSAHRHPARQGGVELDPDRRNGHGCRVRARRVEEFQGDNGENRPAVFRQIGERLAVPRLVRERPLQRLLMDVRGVPPDQRFLVLEPREDDSLATRGLSRFHAETPRMRPGRIDHVGEAPLGRLSERRDCRRPEQGDGNRPDDHELTALADLHGEISFRPLPLSSRAPISTSKSWLLLPDPA